MTLDQAKTGDSGKTAERSHARGDGQAEQFIQGRDQRGVFWAGRREPHGAPANASASGNASGAGAQCAASTAADGESAIMAKPVVVLTGVSGNLGMRLLPLLGRYSVIGVDVNPPKTDCELQFESLDLGPGIIYPDVLRIAARYARLCRDSSGIRD